MIKSAREVIRSLMGNPISALSNNQQHCNTAIQAVSPVSEREYEGLASDTA